MIIKAGSTIYLHVNGAGKNRFLYKATVAGWDGDFVSLLMDDVPPGLEPWTDVILYFDRAGEFFQQPATVEDLDHGSGSSVVDLAIFGDAIPAETRAHGRCDALAHKVHVTIDGDGPYRVNDVSPTGLSFFARAEYHLGEELVAHLEEANLTFSAELTIRCVSEVGAGLVRFGAQISLEPGMNHHPYLLELTRRLAYLDEESRNPGLSSSRAAPRAD